MSSTPAKRKKAAKPALLEQFVTLVVTDGEGRRLTRTLRATDELKVLMSFYHEMVPIVDGVFLYHRRRVWGWETPEDYGMKDGDVIQFLQYTTPDMLVTPVLQDFRGRSFTRTMRKTDRMQVLMDFYTAMVPGDGVGGGVFMYGGEPVLGEQTPADLGMEDWDMIYFVPRRRSKVTVKSDVYISVKVQDCEVTFYRTMRMTEKLEVLIDLFCATVLAAEGDGASIFGASFLFDGRLLRGEETPVELKMEDGAQVDYCPAYG
ncbi:hypothetical protein ACUV84_029868 [Puccinellia chinampoensis]